MINTSYNIQNWILPIYNRIKAHHKLIATVLSIAITVLSLIAAISIYRFNRKLAAMFAAISGLSYIFAAIINSKPKNQIENKVLLNPSSQDSSSTNDSFSPDDSSTTDDSFTSSNSSTSNDNWTEFPD